MQTALVSGIANIYDELENEIGAIHFTNDPLKNLDLIKSMNKKLGKLVEGQGLLLKDHQNCRIRKDIAKELEGSDDRIKNITKIFWISFDEFINGIDQNFEEFDLLMYETLFHNLKELEEAFFQDLEVFFSSKLKEIRKNSSKKIKNVFEEKKNKFEEKVFEKIRFYEKCDFFTDEFKINPPKIALEKLKALKDQTYYKKISETLLTHINTDLDNIAKRCIDYNTLEKKLLIFDFLADLMPQNLMNVINTSIENL